MDRSLRAAVEDLIAQQTGQPTTIDRGIDCGGGSINQTSVIRCTDGRTFFLKVNPQPLPGMFAREAEGLSALAAAGVIRVPRVLGTALADVTPFLLLEHVDSGRPGRNFFYAFGQALAQLHQQTAQARFGFEQDNYIGSTPQPNAWSEDWVVFWRERRLGFQLEWARQQGRIDRPMAQQAERLLAQLPELIGEPEEPACLLHGDLWGGNYLCAADGAPVLIDPATYYGRREAELAMTQLFGGFDVSFYAGYEAVWPLAPGSEQRLAIYKLYHLLNHLNLFGASYRSSCMEILSQF